MGRMILGRALPGLALLGSLALGSTPGLAAAPPPPTTAPAANATTPAATPLETLVSRIALYPDDLVALILPASTFPLEVVEASRYLEKRKKDAKLPLDDSWDASVKSLLNYPTVITAMNDDLDWMQGLGDAVATNQTAVLDAVQSYRRKVMAAGNLKSDDKQTVAVANEIVTIVPANPQVIYVPQYSPTTMVVYGGYSSWGYYGYGYPSYYYPYAPGAALAAGLIWGAAIGAAWNGGHYAPYYGGNANIRINNGDINVGNNVGNGNRGDIGAGNRGGINTNDVKPGGGRGDGGTAWKPSQGATNTAANRAAGSGRIGDGPSASTGARGGGAGSYGPSAGASGRAGSASAGSYGPPSSAASGGRGGAAAGTYGPSAGDRAASSSLGGGDRASASGYGGNYSRGSNANAFSSYGSRGAASSYSSRGAQSRSYSGGGRRR